MVYFQIEKKNETTNPNTMKIKYELVLQVTTQVAADKIEYNTMGAFQTSDCTHMDIILLNGQVTHTPYRKNKNVMHLILQL